MRRRLIPFGVATLAILGCLAFGTGRAEAQIGPGAFSPGGDISDPFAFYYAIYVPNQMIQSMRPTPLDSVNSAMYTRQYYAQANRRSLYDPVSPYAETYDPLRPFSNQGGERMGRAFRFQREPSGSVGTGPAVYFNRVSQYYPEMAARSSARNRNANVSSIRGRSSIANRRGGGGMGGMGGGMGGMGGGMGGMGMPGMGMF